MFNLLLSGLSLVFYFIATKYIKPSRRKKSILVGALMLYLAIYIILFNISYVQLLIYAVVIGIAYPIISVPYVSLTYDVIGKSRTAKDSSAEKNVERVYYGNIGRMTSTGVFLIPV